MKFKAFEKKIWLATPTMHGDEMKYISEAFDSNWVSTEGANLVTIERMVCEKVGCQYAVPLASGTAALHLAVKLAGLKEGDIVFCSDIGIND
jgi:dTDP-4-amino-4,6-dideoxygalactose transaminase